MRTWPEQTQTSPKSTLASVIVCPPLVAVTLCVAVIELGVAGSLAMNADSPMYGATGASIDLPPKLMVTLLPAGANPQTTACAGACCSTMSSL